MGDTLMAKKKKFKGFKGVGQSSHGRMNKYSDSRRLSK